MHPLARLLPAFALLGAAPLHASTPTPHLQPVTRDTAVFAGGCFWGIEGLFEHVRGVISATSGYAGGTAKEPSYEEVSSGTTGHAESVEVVFDPTRIGYADLLKIFFTVAHDPTELDRQGPDVGTQYRSLVVYRNPTQRRMAESYVAELTRAKAFPAPIVTQIVPFTGFYRAEEYHQHYMETHPDSPYIAYNDAPKLVRLRETYPAWYHDGWSASVAASHQ